MTGKLNRYLYNQSLLKTVPLLTPQEEVNYFDLIDTDAQKYSRENLNEGINAIFIFKKPCSFCSANMQFWTRIADRSSKKGFRTFGVVLGNQNEMFRLKEKVKDKLISCTPDNEKKFTEAFRIKMNVEQTLITRNGKVLLSKLGPLSGKDFTKIIRLINRGGA